MMISSFLERDETRVSITPYVAKQYIQLGFQVAIARNAGLPSGFANADYEAMGVAIVDSTKKLLEQSQILVLLNEPKPKELAGLPSHSLIIGHFDSDSESKLTAWCLKKQDHFLEYEFNTSIKSCTKHGQLILSSQFGRV